MLGQNRKQSMSPQGWILCVGECLGALLGSVGEIMGLSVVVGSVGLVVGSGVGSMVGDEVCPLHCAVNIAFNVLSSSHLALASLPSMREECATVGISFEFLSTVVTDS